jgi:hypothetical protein
VSFEETLATLLDARLAPMRAEIASLTAGMEAMRKALPPMLVPLKEAALRMGVSYATARRRARDGEWSVRKDGGRIMVDLTALHPKSEEEIAQLARELENPARRTAHDG